MVVLILQSSKYGLKSIYGLKIIFLRKENIFFCLSIIVKVKVYCLFLRVGREKLQMFVLLESIRVLKHSMLLIGIAIYSLMYSSIILCNLLFTYSPCVNEANFVLVT